MLIVGEVRVLAPALRPFRSSKLSAYFNILSWDLLALSLVALCHQIFFHFCLCPPLMSIEKKSLGPCKEVLRWEYWAPSVQLCPDSILSHTPCCVIARGGGGFDERPQGSDGRLGILWEFLSSAVSYQCFCCGRQAEFLPTLLAKQCRPRVSDKLVHCS